MRQRFALILIFILVIFGSLYVRTLFESREHLVLARQARTAENYEEAVKHYRRSSSFYSPGNKWAATSAEELYDFAHEQTDPKLKIDALRELRSSFISSDLGNTFFDTRSKDLYNKIEEELNFTNKIDLNNRPARNIYGFLSALSFLGWVSLVIVIIWRGAPISKNSLNSDQYGNTQREYFSKRSLIFSAAILFFLWGCLLRIA